MHRPGRRPRRIGRRVRVARGHLPDVRGGGIDSAQGLLPGRGPLRGRERTASAVPILASARRSLGRVRSGASRPPPNQTGSPDRAVSPASATA